MAAPRGSPSTLASATAVRLTRRLSSTISTSLLSSPAIIRPASPSAVKSSFTSARRPREQIPDRRDFPRAVELIAGDRLQQLQVLRPLQQAYQLLHGRLTQGFRLAQ